ncbi:MAG: TonB-dependent receptor, partial [Cyclobacteriaceae bacterium]
VAQGNYLLKIYCLGHEEFTQAVELTKDTMLEVEVKESPYKLKEVTVTGKRETIEVNEGNIRINIKDSPLAAIPNSIDLVAALPAITVSPNREEISIVGRGEPLIYLDNQRITVEQFYGIPVNNIKSIEIIDNPSAKYEADGRALILVKTDKKKLEGTRITLSEFASWKTFFNNYMTVNTQFKKKKFEFKANAGFNALQPRERVESGFELEPGGSQLDARNRVTADGNKPEFVLSGGLFYGINDNDYVSLDVNSYFFDATSDIYGNGAISDQDRTMITRTQNDSDDSRNFVNGSFNFNKKLNQSNLFFGTQYTRFQRDLGAYVEVSSDDNELAPLEQRNQSLSANALSGRLDYELPLGNQSKLELGLNVTTIETQTTQKIRNLVVDEVITDTDYNYEEQIYATYGQVSGKLSEKIRYSTGVRLESYLAEGGFAGQELSVEREQLNLFPKAKVDFKLDSLYNLQLNFARSIKRPNFTELTQVSVFVAPFLVFDNNLNLAPSFTNELSMRLFRQDKSLTLTYFERENPIYSATFF